MDSDKKKYLLDIIEQQLSQKRTQAENAKKSAKERIEETIGSWSAGGDRAHAEAVAEMASQLLSDLEKLHQEILSASEISSNVATPPSHLTTTAGEYFLVNTNAKLPGIQLITPQSPLGRAILNKRAGEEFSFLDKTGKIITIE